MHNIICAATTHVIWTYTHIIIIVLEHTMCFAIDSAGISIIIVHILTSGLNYNKAFLTRNGKYEWYVYICYNLSNVHRCGEFFDNQTFVYDPSLYNALLLFIYFTEHLESQLHKGRIYGEGRWLDGSPIYPFVFFFLLYIPIRYFLYETTLHYNALFYEFVKWIVNNCWLVIMPPRIRIKCG